MFSKDAGGRSSTQVFPVAASGAEITGRSLDSDKQFEAHWKLDVSSAGWRHEHGRSSVCCLSSCCADLHLAAT